MYDLSLTSMYNIEIMHMLMKRYYYSSNRAHCPGTCLNSMEDLKYNVFRSTLGQWHVFAEIIKQITATGILDNDVDVVFRLDHVEAANNVRMTLGHHQCVHLFVVVGALFGFGVLSVKLPPGHLDCNQTSCSSADT